MFILEVLDIQILLKKFMFKELTFITDKLKIVQFKMPDF